MEKEVNINKLSLGLLMGYAVGTLGEGIAYNVFYLFSIIYVNE